MSNLVHIAGYTFDVNNIDIAYIKAPEKDQYSKHDEWHVHMKLKDRNYTETFEFDTEKEAFYFHQSIIDELMQA